MPNDTYASEYHEPALSTIPIVSTVQAFNQFVMRKSSSLYSGGLFDGPDQITFAWRAGDSFSTASPTFVQAVANMVAMNQTIDFSYSSFATSFSPQNDAISLVAVFTTLGFAIYPALFALYPTGERLRNVRAMHYSNGILSSSLWLAYVLFDLMFIVVISVLTIAIWTAKWGGWYAPAYMFVVFVLYGLAATAFSYVVSLFVASQLAAVAFAAVIQVIISMLYFVA